MNVPITEADALRRFPELQELVTVREAGWYFRPIQANGGELEGILGSYSREQYTDALFLFDRTNVSAARVLMTPTAAGVSGRKKARTCKRLCASCWGCPNRA